MLYYPYLNNKNFLKKLDKEPIKEHYLKIIVLDWDENEVAEVQSQTNSGSANINGDASLRRTCSISTILNSNDYDFHEITNIFSLNKKIKVEKGLKNTSEQYTEYPIIWFPLGIYVITGLSIQEQTNGGVQLNLSLQDKMCLLNGSVGGVIPAAAELDVRDSIDAQGQSVTEKVRIRQIIHEVVNHFGGEKAGKIIISDVPENILAPLIWNQDYPLIIKNTDDSASIVWGDGDHNGFTTDLANLLDPNRQGEEKMSHKQIALRLAQGLEAEIPSHWRLNTSLEANEDCEIYSSGEYVGYSWEPFVYSNKQGLKVQAGTTVTSVLDTICNYMNNMEYYYDVYGNFIFKQKANNLNITEANTLKELINEGLETKANYDLSDNHITAYTFEDTQLFTALSCNPNILNIKNDFIIWGQHATLKLPLSYQVCIDDIPNVPDNQSFDNLFYYTEQDTGIVKANFATYNYTYSEWLLDQTPIEGEWYGIDLVSEIAGLSEEEYASWLNGLANLPKTAIQQTIYQIYSTIPNEAEWDLALAAIIENLQPYNAVYHWSINDKDYIKDGALTSFNTDSISKNNWQTYLYYRDLQNTKNGLATSYYWARLSSEWPRIYDLEKNCFKDDFLKQRADCDFYLEIVPSTSLIGKKYNIPSIGRRTIVVSNQNINCLYEPNVPDLVFLDETIYKTTSEDSINQYNKETILAEINQQNSNYKVIDVKQDWNSNYSLFISSLNSAYMAVRDLMYQHSTYNDTMQVTTIPIYYMDANCQIEILPNEFNLSGKYWVKSVSIPFDSNGSMSLNITELLDKF